MARKTCNHPVLPSLRATLVANNIHECPACRIRLHICEIEEVQAALKRRSGIFESRKKAREAEEEKDNSERLIHRALVKRWRLAKIGLHNNLSLFEELRIEGASKASWALQLDKVFELWDDVKDDCCSVPGYMCTQEFVDADETEEGLETVQPVGFSSQPDVRSDPDDDNSGGWQTVRPKIRPAKQPPRETTPDKVPSTAYEESADSEIQGHDTAIQHIEAPSKVARSSYWDGRNRFDLLRDIELDENPDLPETLEPKAVPHILDQAVVMDALKSSRTRTAIAGSPLKRKRSSTSSSNTHTRKHVHIGEKATVICDTDACNTAGLLSDKVSYQRPHFSYTAADQARRRRNFWRRSALYRPRTWALTGENDNINTGHYKTT